MKKFLKFLLIFSFLVIGGIAFLNFFANDYTPPEAPDLKIEITQERVDRGEYLAFNVSGCMECHSHKKTDDVSWNDRNEWMGEGGRGFTKEMDPDLPINVYPSNLTPYFLGDWTDGEIYRAIVNGWGKDGRPLFPIMPWNRYKKMDKEDIYSIIAYLRTLEPVKNDVKKSESLELPLNIIFRFMMPHDAEHQSIPDKSDKVKYGEYMANAAACTDCHTPLDGGRPVTDYYLAGGHTMVEHDLEEFVIPNITPHEDGIKDWTEEQFVNYIKMFAPESSTSTTFETYQNRFMPQIVYGGMTDDDISAIYAYLQTVDPMPTWKKQ